MDTFFYNISRQKTKVTILATYNLVRRCLQLLLEGDRELSVTDIAGTTSELLQKVSQRNPDVVLICLMKDESKNITVMTELLKIAPQTKVVVLCSPDSQLDQREALTLGVTGIVGANQNPRMLTRAIRQVSEGEVWLNQKLVAQLLGNNLNSGNKGSKNHGLHQNDVLTNRELEVVGMIGLAMRNKDISRRLYISEATVRHHLSSIYSKLQVEDRLNLAIYAHRERIVQSSVESV